MPTPVPAVDRAALIMSCLAERSQQPLTLSEIAQATGIHKATCAAVLAALVSHSVLQRTGEKRYLLGPDLVRLAFAYSERYPAYQSARTEIVRLSAKLGLSSSICVLDGEDMVILDICGDTHPAHLRTHRIGARIPLAPPLGTMFKAWGSADEVREWVSRMEQEFEVDSDTQLGVIAAIRSRGFSLGSEQDFDVQLDAAMRRLARGDSDHRGLTVAMMLADKIRNSNAMGGGDTDEEPVNYIVGPVFGADARVVMVINLFGQPGEIRRKDVDRLAVPLLEATARVTRAVAGRVPVIAAPNGAR